MSTQMFLQIRQLPIRLQHLLLYAAQSISLTLLSKLAPGYHWVEVASMS